MSWFITGMWKRLNFLESGSTLKKQAESGSKLGNIWLFEEPEAEAFFKKLGSGIWKRKKRLNFCKSTLKQEAGSGSKLESVWHFEEPEAFFIKHGAGMWKQKLEAVKFLWKRKWKHFEEKSWKQTRKRLTLYGAGRGSKKYSTASTSLYITTTNCQLTTLLGFNFLEE